MRSRPACSVNRRSRSDRYGAQRHGVRQRLSSALVVGRVLSIRPGATWSLPSQTLAASIGTAIVDQFGNRP